MRATLPRGWSGSGSPASAPTMSGSSPTFDGSPASNPCVNVVTSLLLHHASGATSLMRVLLLLAVLGVAACTRTAQSAPAPSQQQPAQQTTAASRSAPGAGAVSSPNADPFPSTYRPFPSRTTLIRNVTVMTAAGPTIQNGAV